MVGNAPDGGVAAEGADLSDDWRALGADGTWAPLAGPDWRPCAPLAGLSSTVSTVVRRGPDGPWLMATPAVLPGPDGAPVAGVWTAVSSDLRRWSRPRLLWAAPLLWARDCGGSHAWAYPSFIDADAPDANFEEVDEAFHLYLVRVALGPDCRAGPERDLMRLPVSWPRAAPER